MEPQDALQNEIELPHFDWIRVFKRITDSYLTLRPHASAIFTKESFFVKSGGLHEDLLFILSRLKQFG